MVISVQVVEVRNVYHVFVCVCELAVFGALYVFPSLRVIYTGAG
jgi:hypothetical protein